MPGDRPSLPSEFMNIDWSETGALMSLNSLEIGNSWAEYGYTTPLDPMAGFKEIMKLQPWLKPWHRHQSRRGITLTAVEIILGGWNLRICGIYMDI